MPAKAPTTPEFSTSSPAYTEHIFRSLIARTWSFINDERADNHNQHYDHLSGSQMSLEVYNNTTTLQTQQGDTQIHHFATRSCLGQSSLYPKSAAALATASSIALLET